MNRLIAIIIIVVISTVLLAASCGYRYGAPKSEWMASGKKLFIAPFENTTPVFGAEALFLSAAVDVFATGGGFELADAEDADLTLKGRILSIETPIGVRRMAERGPKAGSYDMTVEISLELVDRTRQVVWKTKILEHCDYSGSEQIQTVRDNREDALVRVAKKTMQHAYQELMEGI